jgi:short-subunit dehydrogenase
MQEVYALITGGSGGIGLELAKLFAADKINLILVSRNSDELNKVSEYLTGVYKIKIKWISLDLSEIDSAKALFDKVKELNTEVRYLVNNAGFGLHTEFSEMKTETAKSMMELNINSLVFLTKYFLDDMKKRGIGYIVNIASTAAFAAGPYMTIYYATKAFVLSFSEAIAMELKGSGIHIMVACPGPVNTKFQSRAGLQRANIFKFQSVMSSERVAYIIYKRMKQKRIVAVIGYLNILNISFSRFLPRVIIRNITKWFNQKRT